jgi:two-component system sensor histidine kinase/response regulator
MSHPEAGRLLIVDDEAALVTALVRTLQAYGYQPTGMHSTVEALSALRAQSFDILITDLMMPGMDGVELVRAAQEIDGSLVSIVMTGHGTIDSAVKAMKSGALDYILKPFDLTTMMPVLSRALIVRRLRLDNVALARRLAQRNEDLEALNRELHTTNRELDAFTSTVSHDLRQPLHGMMGFSELLLSEKPGALNERQKEYLADIATSGRHLVELTDDLLRFARVGRESLETQQIDVSGLANSVVTELRATAGGDEVDVRLGALPNVNADPSLLRQVFCNLLSNAFKFRRPNVPAIVEITGRSEAGQCVYCVQDNGIGFDMQKAGKLFSLFQRMPGTERFEGTGVGLSIVQRIIERHGGRVHAEAQVGKGAQFTFTLPLPQATHNSASIP